MLTTCCCQLPAFSNYYELKVLCHDVLMLSGTHCFLYKIELPLFSNCFSSGDGGDYWYTHLSCCISICTILFPRGMLCVMEKKEQVRCLTENWLPSPLYVILLFFILVTTMWGICCFWNT